MTKKPISRVRSIAFLLLCGFWAALAVAQDMLQLGGLSYSRVEAEYLRAPVTRSYAFFRAVGGVAFSTVAQGKDGLSATAVSYDASAPDGQRLVVSLKNPSGTTEKVRGSLYDWQLVPISRFAEDENGSAMTLFGRLKDQTAQEALEKKSYRVINYHPALDNTLVGLRLMQADIMILRPDAADLFRQGGQVVLGAGEGGHNVQQNTARFANVGGWLDQQSQAGNKFQSYVVGDLDQKVEFFAQNGRLQFVGRPYWAAWRGKYEHNEISSRMQQLAPKHKALTGQHNTLLREAREREQAGALTSAQAQQIKQALSKLRGQVEAIEKELDELQGVEMMPAYSRELSDLIRRNDGINPLVYATVTKVMHYRALFKHVQQQNPTAYAAFVRSLESVKVAPAVRTPTVQHGQ